MKAVIGFLLMLVSPGVETFCDGRQNKTQCYGALGGSVVIRLMNDISESLQFQWSNSKGSILKRFPQGFVTNTLPERLEFFSNNGTVRMNNLSRTDDDEYTFQLFNEDGLRTAFWTLQLNIQAPVSSVRLVSECLSQGQKNMSCSAEGDSPQYNWTLDGHTLRDDQLLSGNNEANEIILKQTVSGRLVCAVRNNVSRASGTETISTCGYIFIECQLLNGTNITQWVFEANNTLCKKLPTTTTTSTTITSDIVGKKSDITRSNNPCTKFTSSNQTSSYTDGPWYMQTRYIIIMGSVLFILLIFLMAAVVFFFVHKRRASSRGGDEDKMRQELTTRGVQPQTEMGAYGQITFAAKNNRPTAGCSGAQREEQVEYGQIKLAQQPRQKDRLTGAGSEHVEYGEIKFAERPQQKNRQVAPDGAPHRSEQVEYGEIKY